MQNNEQQSLGLGGWLMHSITAKLLFIIFLIMLLLIPSEFVKSLIRERQVRQGDVVREISSKWAGEQTISGPVLTIPYIETISFVDKTNGAEVMRSEDQLKYLYVLADDLKIDLTTKTELLHRGIFDAVVYQTVLRATGHIAPPQLEKTAIDPQKIRWEDARLVVGIGDLKGLKSVPSFTIAGRKVEAGADETGLGLFGQSIVVDAGLTGLPQSMIPFAFDLDIKGSHALQFTQLAKTTSVMVKGDWVTPKFEGQFLPDTREVTESGFEATWIVPNHFLSLPKQWMSSGTAIEPNPIGAVDEVAYYSERAARPAHASAGRQADVFGVRFLQAVDHYKKVDRTAKYAILIVLLTFVALFFTEVIGKRQVHIIQYGLIGAAMIIYYCLLLSFSEHIGFNAAYAVASVATVALVSLFIAKILGQRKTAWLFAAILLVFYLFIFVIIQLEEMALLFGSIGLFITVSLLMYFSSKINWLQQER